jgi:hypothetical protein
MKRKTESFGIRGLGDLSGELKFLNNKNDVNIDEYHWQTYENDSPELVGVKAANIIATLDAACNADMKNGKAYEYIIPSSLGFYGEYSLNRKFSLAKTSVIPIEKYNSTRFNSSIVHLLSPANLSKLYANKTVSALEQKMLKNTKIVKNLSYELNRVFELEKAAIKNSKEAKKYVDILKYITDLSGDLSYISDIDSFDYYFGSCRYDMPVYSAFNYRKEYESIVKNRTIPDNDSLGYYLFHLIGKMIPGEDELLVSNIKDQSYSFLNGRLHPYFLIYAICGRTEEFLDYLAPYKYEPGSIIYIRSSIPEYAIEVTSRSDARYFEKRRIVENIKNSTIKNSCGGIIVGYAPKEKCKTRLKSYTINLFSPAETVTIPEKHLNFLERKRKVKDSDDDLMNTPL